MSVHGWASQAETPWLGAGAVVVTGSGSGGGGGGWVCG